jgi:hypothetical protein
VSQYGTIKTYRHNGTGGVLEDTEALSDPNAPLVITRCFPGEDEAVAITHKASGKKVYLPSSLTSARIALPELLKITDWTHAAVMFAKDTVLLASVEAIQDAADKQLEDETVKRLREKK